MKNADAQILIVDDVLENIQVLGSLLRSAGYQIRVGRSGVEALRQVKQEKPDLILLDVMMPEMDGHEACRQLQANPHTADIPIIFLSAKSTTEDELLGLELGAVDYISKPFDANIVLARVKRHIGLVSRSESSIREVDKEMVERWISEGESTHLEFKSTLRWNVLAERSDKNIELAAAKTLVAFLNSDGGILLVGVEDDGSILGLEADRFKSHDKLMLHVNNVIEAHVGMEYADYLDIDIVSVGEKEVLSIRCRPSPRPAFLVTRDAEDIYIRVGPASQRLTTREAIEYLTSRNQMPG